MLANGAGTVARVALSRIESKDPAAFQEISDALRTKNFFFVKLNPEQAQTVSRCFAASAHFFSQNDVKTKNSCRVSSKLGYKNNAPKERFQFRVMGGELSIPTTNPPDFIQTVRDAYNLFDYIGMLCLDIATKSCGVPLSDVLRAYGDPNPLPTSAWATSVFNVFNYYNTPEAAKAENCVAHIDPGFITVLGKAPVTGLEAIDGTTGEYVLVEPMMADDEVCVLPGETLERLVGKQIKGNLHRVVKGEGSRLNLTFEIRPMIAIYHPWGSEAELKSRAAAMASRADGVVDSEVKDVY